jgi:dipeptidyl aminopeptidase/acylaminoacyl peptidase
MVDGGVSWLETRPRESGRTTIVCCRPGGKPRDVVPAPFSVRARAHEYGGGAYCFGAGSYFFVHDDDQNIHRVAEGQDPEPLTHVEGCYFADLQHDGTRGALVCVVEDHATDVVENRLVRIDARDGRVETLWHGSDFVSSPRISEDGKRLVWLAWDRPHMPWTRTRLWVGDLAADGSLREARPVGPEDASIFQPEWGPDGLLYFVSDADDWWNLYRLAEGGVRQLTALQGELALPQWVFGMRTYGWTGPHRIAAAMIRDGLWHVLDLDLTTGAAGVVDTGWTQLESLSTDGRSVAMLAGAANRPLSVVLRDEHGAERVLREASSVSLDPGTISLPEAVSFPVGDGEIAHGLHYRPLGLGQTPPPLLVKCHGGPTAAASSALDLRIQFWTSRGFAVLDVNYRGSTGYGRPFREKLYGRWGLADVEDAVAGATWLADRGLADPRRLLISGSSAGGFTVLSALTFHDAFAAGASYYGVSEIASLFETTSKFEADYGHWLLGDDIAGANRERSPLRHADRLTRPVIFFQGLRDRVVLPEQAETMYEALRSRGVPVSLLTYPEEGHGFRQEGTIRSCLESELAFYRRVLGIPSAEPSPGLDIANLR